MITNGLKQLLRRNYETACNAYLLQLANMWEWDCSESDFWVGDEIGSVYIYGDRISIGMEDIIYCVENEIKESVYEDFLDYCSFAQEFGFVVPNFKSYCKGAPIVPQETRERLVQKKNELTEMIRSENKKLF